MSATLIDGKKLSAQIREEIAVDAQKFESKYGRKLGLAVILVGENPASQVYVRNKVKACEQTGIASFGYYLPESSTTEEVIELVSALNDDEKVDGLLVQLPLPKHIDEKKVLATVSPKKDVDGFHSVNAGNLLLGNPCLPACTPAGIMELIKTTGVDLTGKNAVVIGRSNIVGKPMALLLLQENGTVTVTHSRTKELKAVTSRADILVVAVGKPRMITEDYVKEGAVVIDVGIHRDSEGHLCGDVDYESVAPKCSAITPVPGGVGPMTIAMLMNNCVESVKLQG